MWEKFKESKFARKCKEMSGKGGFVAAIVCIALVVAIVLSVSIATNRAKKKYGLEDENQSTVQGNVQGENTESNAQTGGNESNGQETADGTVNAPVHGDQSEKPVGGNQSEKPVGGEAEEFKLELPVVGIIAKGHDATIQVWNETLGAYKVHLGLDIASEKSAPVLAAADGTVTKVWDDALMGKCVAIHHGDDIYTFYKNLDPVLSAGVTENAEIKCGQQIGKVGESAISELADEPHLHIEMTVGGIAVDPQDYLSEEAKDTIASASDAYEEGAQG